MRPIWVAVVVASLLYLIVDLYPRVKSVKAMAVTFSFWLQWLVFSVINITASAVIQVSAGKNIQKMVGDDQLMSQIVIVFLSVLATFTIIQSFTLKIADIKFVDMSAVLDLLKKTVLSEVNDQVINLNRTHQQKLADRLQSKFNNDLPRLRNEFATVMSFGGRDVAEIGEELKQLEAKTTAHNLSFAKELALRIAKTDVQRAETLVK